MKRYIFICKTSHLCVSGWFLCLLDSFEFGKAVFFYPVFKGNLLILKSFKNGRGEGCKMSKNERKSIERNGGICPIFARH